MLRVGSVPVRVHAPESCLLMSSAPPSPSQRSTLDPLLHREVRVETPEHVVVGYALADLGSRFLALLLDVLLITMTILALVLGALWGLGSRRRIGRLRRNACRRLSFGMCYGYGIEEDCGEAIERALLVETVSSLPHCLNATVSNLVFGIRLRLQRDLVSRTACVGSVG
jgi:hypothetical protein